MNELLAVTLVLAVSEYSRRELLDYWQWLGSWRPPPVLTIDLGADFLAEAPASVDSVDTPRRTVLSVGILEPRKNQMLLLDACERLWRDGEDFELVLVGRVNAHFAKPILWKIDNLRKSGFAVRHYKKASDKMLWSLYRGAHFAVFPSQSEGSGLPVREALWAGVPCICTDIPAVSEFSKGGGCLEFRSNDADSLHENMKRLLNDSICHQQLRRAIADRHIPTWSDTGQQVVRALTSIPDSNLAEAGHNLE